MKGPDVSFTCATATSRLSNALSGNLNADGGGTVVVVAGGSVWGSTSWEDGPAATARLEAAFQNSHEPLASQLRKVIDSFASGDAAAGHPQLGSASDTGSQSPTQTQTQTQPTGSSTAGGASSNSSSPVGLIIGLVVLAIALALVLLRGGGRMRRTMRTSHRHEEEQADQREQLQALDCYQQAERRLKQSRDEYQFERATAAVKDGLEHVNAAERLLNQTEGTCSRPSGAEVPRNQRIARSWTKSRPRCWRDWHPRRSPPCAPRSRPAPARWKRVAPAERRRAGLGGLRTTRQG